MQCKHRWGIKPGYDAAQDCTVADVLRVIRVRGLDYGRVRKRKGIWAGDERYVLPCSLCGKTVEEVLEGQEYP